MAIEDLLMLINLGRLKFNYHLPAFLLAEFLLWQG